MTNLHFRNKFACNRTCDNPVQSVSVNTKNCQMVQSFMIHWVPQVCLQTASQWKALLQAMVSRSRTSCSVGLIIITDFRCHSCCRIIASCTDNRSAASSEYTVRRRSSPSTIPPLVGCTDASPVAHIWPSAGWLRCAQTERIDGGSTLQRSSTGVKPKIQKIVAVGVSAASPSAHFLGSRPRNSVSSV